MSAVKYLHIPAIALAFALTGPSELPAADNAGIELGEVAVVTGTVVAHNVVQPGDTLNMWFNPFTKHLQHIQVNSTFQGDTVELTATYSTLGSGVNYASFGQVDVPAKQLSVQVQNYNYARLAY